MADPSKTEKATPKRRSEARAKGQVARSHDLSSTAALLAAFAALVVGGPHMLSRLEAIVPSARRQSGVVKISSVGMFGTYSSPSAFRKSADIQRAVGRRPMVKSVPGPR